MELVKYDFPFREGKGFSEKVGFKDIDGTKFELNADPELIRIVKFGGWLKHRPTKKELINRLETGQGKLHFDCGSKVRKSDKLTAFVDCKVFAVQKWVERENKQTRKGPLLFKGGFGRCYGRKVYFFKFCICEKWK